MSPLLLAAFVATTGGYFLLDPEQNRVVPWLALYTLQFVLLVGIVRRPGLRLSHLLVAAVAARALLWFTIPVLEADYFRYLWDGHVFASGVNPFLYAPHDAALDHLETDYRFFVTFGDISTIYPPVAQFFFRLSHAIAPDSLLGMKVLLTGFDLATGWIIVRWLQERGSGVALAALWFLNPLVLKEVANSAHVDIVAVFFATAAVWTMSRGAGAKSWLLLVLSIGAKLYAVALAPLFVRCDRAWMRNGMIAAVALVLFYVPFLGAGSRLFSGTAAYGENWIFNASFFRVVAAAWAIVLPDVLWAPRLTVVALFAAALAYITWRLRSREQLPEAALWTLGVMLLLSPVVDAWYVLWLLPFAVVVGSVPWLAFSYLVAFSYTWFYSQDLAFYFQALEYGLLLALLYRHSRNSGLLEAQGTSRVT